MRYPEGLGLSIAKGGTQERAFADKRRVTDDELRHRPLRPARIRQYLLALDAFDVWCAVPCQHGILDLNSLEVAQDRVVRRIGFRAEVPLKIADPQHKFGDRCSARIDFESEKLMWIDIVRVHPFDGFLAAQRLQQFENFAFELFHLLKRDV